MLRVGVHRGLAFGDAGFIFLPIGRRLGVSFTAQLEQGGRITSMDVIRLNKAMWRNAVRYLAAHPSADWRRLCVK